jgi:predicted membrane protein
LFLRGVSLALAGIASVIGLVFPFLLAPRATGLNQTILLFMMAGISGAFIDGVGFRIENAWLKTLTHPAFTWPIITLTAGALIFLRF